MKEYELLQIEYEALKEAFQNQGTEAGNLAQAYEQLHAAYSSEEHLYKEASSRVQQLEQILQENKLEFKDSTSTASNLSVASSSPALKSSSNGVEHESLRDDLLDMDAALSDSMNHPPPEAPMPNAPASGRQSLDASFSGTLAGAQTPPHSSGTPPHAQSKRHSFTLPNYSLLLPPQQKSFHPDPSDAAFVNFQFFQLIAISVASHLSCSPEYADIAAQTLPVEKLYEEAMEKQIQATKYANWLEQRLRITVE